MTTAPTAADLALAALVARELLDDILPGANDDAQRLSFATDRIASALSESRANSAAMGVVEACVVHQHEVGSCHLCGFEGPTFPHDEDCPLVTGGFIDEHGARL